jgi:hypothetical protein
MSTHISSSLKNTFSVSFSAIVNQQQFPNASKLLRNLTGSVTSCKMPPEIFNDALPPRTNILVGFKHIKFNKPVQITFDIDEIGTVQEALDMLIDSHTQDLCAIVTKFNANGEVLHSYYLDRIELNSIEDSELACNNGSTQNIIPSKKILTCTPKYIQRAVIDPKECIKEIIIQQRKLF